MMSDECGMMNNGGNEVWGGGSWQKRGWDASSSKKGDDHTAIHYKISPGILLARVVRSKSLSKLTIVRLYFSAAAYW
jgi:hypothetical protein